MTEDGEEIIFKSGNAMEIFGKQCMQLYLAINNVNSDSQNTLEFYINIKCQSGMQRDIGKKVKTD